MKSSVLFKFKSFYFSFSSMLAISQGFFLPYLISRNSSNADIGLLMTISTLTGIIGQLGTGILCDSIKKIKVIFILWTLLLSGMVLWLYGAEAPLSFIAAIVGVSFFQSALIGLIDSWIIESSSELENRFGEIRAFGSLGWGISTAVIGWLLTLFDFKMIPIWFIIFALILLIVMRPIQDAQKQGDKHSQKKVSFKALIQNKRFQYLNGIYICFYMLLGMVGMFTMILMEEEGATEFHMGLYLAIVAFSEIPCFILSKHLMKKIKRVHILTISISIMLFRILILLFINNLYILILSGLLQAFTMPLFMVASKKLTDDLSSPETRTSFQMFSVAAYTGIGSGVTSILSGSLSEVIGMDQTLILYLFLNLVTIVFSIMYAKAYYSTKVLN
ncbi:MFS transporter [Niallia sp. Krafla_26]|uniref:MFS transporter n=1 Tax=Niallia sp. Krafla_26 TaxID=3064703 RepID=UPI003D177D5A